MSGALATIDLGRLWAGERDALLADLREAARGPGFFYLVGNGVPDRLVGDVLALSRRFFALPETDKRAIEMVGSPHFRGYTGAGAEITRGRPDWREQLDIGRERAALPPKPGAPAWTRLIGPNQWPAGLPELRPALLAYLDAVTALGVDVLRLVSAAIGQDEEALAPIFAPEPNQLAHRPAARSQDRSAGMLRGVHRTEAVRLWARGPGSRRGGPRRLAAAPARPSRLPILANRRATS